MSNANLEQLADYLVFSMEKQERKEKKILTDNRLKTVNKRELSFEGLASKFDHGEDSIYPLINESKSTIFAPKHSITQEDLERIPFLAQVREAIQYWEKLSKKLSGRERYIAKQAAIELAKDQYIIREAYLKPITPAKLTHSKAQIPLDEDVYIDSEGNLSASGVSLCLPKVCSAILCNYSKLKQDSYDNFMSDTWYLMQDFDRVAETALSDRPMYDLIVQCKIDNMSLADISAAIEKEFGKSYAVEYISTLWRNRIPQLIAQAAQDEWINWHYFTQEKGRYKRCSKCYKIKLATTRYFNRNRTSKDGLYSVCKACRKRER